MLKPIIGIIVFAVIGEIISATFRGLELFGVYIFIAIQVLYVLLEIAVIIYIIYTSVGVYRIVYGKKALPANLRTIPLLHLYLTKFNYFQKRFALRLFA